MRFVKIYILITLYLSTSVIANNLSVGSVELVGQDVTNDFTFIQFNVSWDNSWRNDMTGAGQSAPYNYDAIWIFVKYKVQGEDDWKHATLNTSGHTAPSGSTIDVPSDGTGGFIYRDGNGTGTFSLTAVQLRWNYGVDGITDDNANVTVKVFATEMVYIPQGSFYVGDGSNTNVGGRLHRADDTSVPFLISDELQITLGFIDPTNLGNNNTVGQWTGSLDDFNNITTQTLPETYPKGYDAFYMMKYEITQGQYVDFLNCLTRNQQNNRTATDLSIIPVINHYVMQHPSGSTSMSGRNSIKCDADIPSSGPVTFYCDYNNDGTPGDGKDIASNYLHVIDGFAYADWAGLRPFAELEFEKALRGSNQVPWSQTPLVDGYGWGNTSLHAVSYLVPPTFVDVINPGEPNELPYSPSTGTIGNSAYSETSSGPTVPDGFGVLRAGIFATTSSNRATSGSSYYGVMELTGNVWEVIIGLGRSEGRSFTGKHGDGFLNSNGGHNVSDWPGNSSHGLIMHVSGMGYRGGGVDWPSKNLRISDRQFANVTVIDRNWVDGMRLARTAP